MKKIHIVIILLVFGILGAIYAYTSGLFMVNAPSDTSLDISSIGEIVVTTPLTQPLNLSEGNDNRVVLLPENARITGTGFGPSYGVELNGQEYYISAWPQGSGPCHRWGDGGTFSKMPKNDCTFIQVTNPSHITSRIAYENELGGIVSVEISTDAGLLTATKKNNAIFSKNEAALWIAILGSDID